MSSDALKIPEAERQGTSSVPKNMQRDKESDGV